MNLTNKYLERYLTLCEQYSIFERDKIPLCAAENFLTDFSQLNNHVWEGKYCLLTKDFDCKNDFVGAQFINRLLQLTQELCNNIFESTYANPKMLSGMNCYVTALISCMPIIKKRTALVTDPNSGGHQSIPAILELFGFDIDYMPYSYDEFDLDYNGVNELLDKKDYGVIIFAQSDLICAPDLNHLHISNKSLVIYDATQTLGLIAAKLLPNPLLVLHNNLLLIGGTHKTFPGPSCGLIMTNDNNLAALIDKNISPVCIRDFQPSNTSKLLLALIEFQENGYAYQERIIWTANTLAKLLENAGFNIAKKADCYSKTHQIFILTDKPTMDIIYSNAIKFGITLNKKIKPLFGGYGIRLGVQQIARYKWEYDDLEKVSQLILFLCDRDPNSDAIRTIMQSLILHKRPQYILL